MILYKNSGHSLRIEQEILTQLLTSYRKTVKAAREANPSMENTYEVTISVRQMEKEEVKAAMEAGSVGGEK